MSASLADIARWFREGVKQGSRYMLVVCDTFDHDDYPVYVSTDVACLERYDHYSNHASMQRVMEVYDLTRSWQSQANGGERVFNLPRLRHDPSR